MVLDASLLSTQHYKVRIKGKVEQSRKGVAPSPAHWCSSYRKGSLRVTLDYGRQHYSALRKIKNRKAAGLDEIPPEVWKTRQFDDILLRHCNAVYNQNPIDRWMKGCILPFPKKGDLGLAKNYRGITLTSIAAKIYNALLRNRIEPKIDNILRKNQNGFRRNRSTTSQILTIRRILEGVRAKNLQATLIFVDFRLHSQRKDGTNPTSVQHT